MQIARRARDGMALHHRAERFDLPDSQGWRGHNTGLWVVDQAVLDSLFCLPEHRFINDIYARNRADMAHNTHRPTGSPRSRT
jgi:hypothetical protein